MDPTTLKLAGDFMGGLGQAIGGAPSSASAVAPFDASGWVVNFGQGNIEAQRTEPAPKQIGDTLGAVLPYALGFVAVVVLWKLARR